MTIVSMIKINGEWVRQEDVPPEQMRKIVQQVITRAAENIGFDVNVKKKRKTA